VMTVEQQPTIRQDDERASALSKHGGEGALELGGAAHLQDIVSTEN
jgi:hypothetical protein